jgi:hypothetical protein
MKIIHQYPHKEYPWLLQVNYHENKPGWCSADVRFVNVSTTIYDYISSGIIVAIFKCKPKLKPIKPNQP